MQPDRVEHGADSIDRQPVRVLREEGVVAGGHPAAERTLRIAAQIEFAQLHFQRIQVQQPRDQRIADADDQLERFDCLEHADDPR